MEVLREFCGQRRLTSFLLLYLFVLEAAADCPKPQLSENIVLSDEALLLNDFPEGSVVTLECTNGYVWESGSEVLTCTKDNWSELDLSCKKKDCGPPESKPNMSFNTSRGTLFGAVIKVLCDKGYQISGSSYKQCYATGWSGAPSKCEIITCDIPPSVANGRSSWDTQDDPKYGEMIQYTCDDGYTLIGKDSILCSEEGEYDSQPPQCNGVTTEERITSTSPPSLQEASTSADSSATPTAHRDKTITSSAAPTISPSERGGKDILRTEDKVATTSLTPTTASLFKGEHNETANTNEDIGYIPLILAVIGVLLVAFIVVLFLHKYLLRRKGSYDTREDQKPELLQFQNV